MPDNRSFKVVNRELPRLESMKKATGQAKYTEDLAFTGLAYAALVRSPYSHAKVLSIDTSEAEKIPGYLGCALPEDARRTISTARAIRPRRC